MIRSILHTLGGILLLFSLSLSTARYIEAQVANSTVTGRITDSSDALVSGAQVTLNKTDTKLVIKTPTNSDGIYTFPSLQPGPYRIQVTQAGFKTATTELTVTVAQTVNIDLALEVGRNTETINVESTGMADLEINDATISYTVNTRQVSDLPLNGRNPYGLAALSPGITPGWFLRCRRRHGPWRCRSRRDK